MARTVFSITAALFCAIAGVAHGANDQASQPPAAPEPAVIPGSYIAELQDSEDTGAFITSLKSDLGQDNVSRRTELKSRLFNGVSFRLSDDLVRENDNSTVNRIANLPQVKRLWPVQIVPRPQTETKWTAAGVPTQPNSRHRRRQNTVPYPPHVQTQVDKLHARGLTGKGVRISIIDSGVDYLHPALGGCFGPGCIVSYGYDLVGDAYNGNNAPVPDQDPLDQCDGHGTHVAGIIGAQQDKVALTGSGLKGAAPGATLGMYRVFGCTGGSGTDVLIAAVTKAFEDGSDIITGSLGLTSGWSEDAFSVTVSRMVAAGVHVTFAAGNEVGGTEGMFGISAPSTGDGVLAVSSYEASLAPTYDAAKGTVVYTREAVLSGSVSRFTSWGPNYELQLKPQFGAPGGQILSLWPTTLGGYAVNSGTSMATPLAAGVIALLIEARGKIAPGVVEKMLSSTAKPAPSFRLSDAGQWVLSDGLAPVVQQGAGLIQALDALESTITFDVPNLSLNDTDNFSGSTSFKVTNLGQEVATYNVSHSPALTASSLTSIYRNSAPDMSKAAAKVSFEPSTLTLAPGESAEVNMVVSPPTDHGFDPASLPMYSGWVTLNGTGSTGPVQSLSLPYFGLAGSMRNATVMAVNRMFMLDTANMRGSGLGDNVTFQLAVPSTHPEWAVDAGNATANVLVVGSMPVAYTWLVLGSPEVRIEVVPLEGPALADAKDNGLGVKVLGSVGAEFPIKYSRAAGTLTAWDGSLANGTWVPAGRYRLGISALKIMADRTKRESWDLYNSPEFYIRWVKAA
ncbi:hypothetical protein MCOR29_001412 [Pyricularia oryzae]|nr:hypothetical protein MCOR29_001412 [Pyricularia oryzae]KAI6409301.1 hypothetical protein MCOR23_000988 [Pyricularia oryzae]KAI6416801.1 hypothetical protein MCOR20_011696 [Pyricularia oryzae]KAI6559378.1 hypothetical protein MCOR03_004863 [Pyricularia oryzae]